MAWGCPDCDSEFGTYGGVTSHHTQVHDRDIESMLAELRGDEIREQYVEQRVSANVLSDELDVSRPAINSALDALDIERRGHSEAEKVKNEQMSEAERREQTQAAREELPDGGGLAIAWREQPDEMAESASVNAALGSDAREENGMRGVTGQAHHRWTGGKDIYDAVKRQLGTESWETTRQRVRADAYGLCAMCGEMAVFDRGLDVHHIVPLLCGGTNGDWNLLALCRSCHQRAEAFTRRIPEVESVLVDG